MSQFLLVQAQSPTTTGNFRFERIPCGEPLLADAAAMFEDASLPVWNVTDAMALDDLAHEARDVLRSGRPLQASRLGRLLGELIAQGARFRLFWADDFTDLPAPTTIDALLALLAEQVADDGANLELHARWGWQQRRCRVAEAVP